MPAAAIQNHSQLCSCYQSRDGRAMRQKMGLPYKAVDYKVDADGQRLINEARNMLSQVIIDLEVMKGRLRIVPLALAESVKPLEKIGDVRIVDLGGRGPADSLLGALLQYRASAPIIDQLLAQAGFTGASPVEALVGAVKPAPVPPAVQPPTATKATAED